MVRGRDRAVRSQHFCCDGVIGITRIAQQIVDDELIEALRPREPPRFSVVPVVEVESGLPPNAENAEGTLMHGEAVELLEQDTMFGGEDPTDVVRLRGARRARSDVLGEITQPGR